MTPKLYIVLVICFSFLVGCKPKHHIESLIVNNSNDTLIITNISTSKLSFILPGEAIHVDGGLYQRSNPEKKFKCCPCENKIERFSIVPKTMTKILSKNLNEGNNWSKPKVEGERLSKIITCIFEINQEDIK
jgi:hypothetical protein